MSADEIVVAISRLNGPELERVREAVERRREQLVKQSSVVERRNYGRGILQLEYRANPKTGTRRGPYWYFYGSPQLLVKQSRAGAHTPPDRPKSRLRCLIPESQPLTKRSKSSTITSQRRGQCSKRTLITKS